MTVIIMIVTLQVVNISIDPADTNAGKEDLSINEIESCVELILEVCLKHSDAVRESDEHDDSSCKPGAGSLILFSVDNRVLAVEQPLAPSSSHNYCDHTSFFESIGQSIQSPPPKVA